MSRPRQPNRLLTIRDMARAWGASEVELKRLVKEPWFPEHDARYRYDRDAIVAAAAAAGVDLPIAPGKAVGDVEAVQKARKRQKRAGRVTPGGGGAEQASEDRIADALRVLRETEDPVELSRAGACLAARILAQAFEEGTASQKEVTALARALEEVRRSSSGALAIAQERGELVTRERLDELGGELAAALVQGLDRLEAALPDQVLTWHTDPAWRALAADSQRRAVASWAHDQTRNARRQLATQLR